MRHRALRLIVNEKGPQIACGPFRVLRLLIEESCSDPTARSVASETER